MSKAPNDKAVKPKFKINDDCFPLSKIFTEKYVLKKYMKILDVPPWFHSMSAFQMKAADSLLNGIRDDSNQDTTHRVRIILSQLGITPIVTTSSLKITMRMCQGNDLAFLWYLLELYYTKDIRAMLDENYKYSYNEKLIISAIAHLDMIPTLRELDKILPPQGQKICKVNKCAKKSSSEIICPKPIKRKHKNFTHVYLQPLVRPKLTYMPKCEPPKYRKIVFKPYEKYEDPYYIAPNEASRWYADPNLNFGLCGRPSSVDIVRKILNEEIKKIVFQEHDSEINPNTVMCSHHRALEEIKISLLNKICVETRDKCLAQFTNEPKKERLRNRFNKQLEENLKIAAEEFRAICEKYEMQTWFRLLVYDIVNKNMDFGSNDYLLEKLRELTAGFGEKCRCKRSENPSNELEKCSFEFGHHGKPKRNRIYFHAQKNHAPFKFDHAKIFNNDELTIEKTLTQHIKGVIEEAIDIEDYVDEDEAISGWLQKTFVEEVELWNEKLRIKKTLEDHCGGDIEECHLDKIVYDPKDPKRIICPPKKVIVPPYLNPRDDKLMNSLLIDAMNKMSKNPYFVLASMPLAYKLPVLKEWIRAKYGLIYSHKERLKANRETNKILEEMNRAIIAPIIPKRSSILFCRETDYKNRALVFNMSQKVLDEVCDKMKEQMLRIIEIYWAALKPYYFPSGPPREIFYAYMPSMKQDILLFKPWHGEYGNMFTGWLEKQKYLKEREHLPCAFYLKK